MQFGSTSRTFPGWAAFAVFAMISIPVVACRGREPEWTPPPPPAQPQYKPTATVRELMHSVIDPASDVVWHAVQSQVTEAGIVEIRPRTDEEWAAVRRGAINLLEAANLLMMPGRPVAHPGEKSVTPGVELEPHEIAKLIAKNPAAWNARAIVLHEVVTRVIKAIDAKDADKVFELGEQIEAVCESCHRQYWYPNEIVPDFQADPSEARPPANHSELLRRLKRLAETRIIDPQIAS